MKSPLYIIHVFVPISTPKSHSNIQCKHSHAVVHSNLPACPLVNYRFLRVQIFCIVNSLVDNFHQHFTVSNKQLLRTNIFRCILNIFGIGPLLIEVGHACLSSPTFMRYSSVSPSLVVLSASAVERQSFFSHGIF